MLLFYHSVYAATQPLLPSDYAYTECLWAWHVVNTRSVYSKRLPPNSRVRGEDNYALAPYLDMLNHTYTARVGFNAAFLLPCLCCLLLSVITSIQKGCLFVTFGFTLKW